MSLVRDFPLFPLGIVALPSELVPLHIFEERYKTMIDECLESGAEFGIVWLSDEGLRPIGCACEVTEVLERMDDGRMNIITRGTRPFERQGPVRLAREPADVAGDVAHEALELLHRLGLVRRAVAVGQRSRGKADVVGEHGAAAWGQRAVAAGAVLQLAAQLTRVE